MEPLLSQNQNQISNKIGAFFKLVFVLLIVGNIFYLDYKYFFATEKTEPILKENIVYERESRDQIPVQNDACPAYCVDLLKTATMSSSKKETAETKNTVSSPPVPVQSVTVIKKETTKGEFFIPLGSGNISEIGAWKNIDSAQATFNPKNYANLKEIYFEVIMHIPNAQGVLKARLLNTSDNFIFAGEELTTVSGTGELKSVRIPLPLDSVKTYKVQMYTTMTSGVLDLARIRVVTE